MPNGRRVFVAACVAICAVSVSAPAQAEAKAPPSAFESLDASVLSAALRELQMWEVSEYLTAQLGRSDQSIALLLVRADALIDKATADDTGLGERRKLLNQSIGLLRQVVAGTANPPDDKSLIKHLEYRLRLAAVAGMSRPEPYALRLAYLHGTEQDRLDVIRLTARASNLMIELDNEIDDLLVKWHGDLEKLVVVVPLLRRLRARMLYQAAWVYLYRGLALPTGPTKRQFLGMAQTAAQKCERRSQRPYRLRLVRGMAARALGKHRQAAEHLSTLNTAGVPTDVRIQAMFEAARNLAEQAKVQEALQAVETFYENGSKLLGKSGKLQMEVHSAILRSYVYEVQAAGKTDAKQKQALIDEAFKALVEVIRKHGANPEIRRTMFEIIARRYGGEVDPGNAASLKKAHSAVLLALADLLLKQKPGSAEAFTKAVSMLKEVLGRQDPVATMMRADTMWNLALAYHELRDNVRAGQMFAGLASKFPGHQRARDAAMNATATFRGVVSQRIKNKKPISTPIRKQFIAALNVLLGNDQWVKQPEVASQFYDLGWQYEKLAAGAAADEKLKHHRQAIEAYRKVPQANLRDYMDARHQALALEVEVMGAGGDVPLDVAEQLVKRLTDYSALAGREARKAASKNLTRDFMAWGSRAAFNVAIVHYKHMDRQDKAMAMLRALPEEWPQTPVLEESSEFLIRKLIEQGKILEAGKEVEKFMEQYPQRGSQLIALVIDKVREAIRLLAKDPRTAKQRAEYRDGYQRFAKLLYESAVKDPKTTPRRLVKLKQMYADALAETGRAVQALKLFRECKAEEDKKLNAEREKIDKEFDAKIKAMTAIADRGAAALQKAIGDFLEGFPKAYGTKIQDSYQGGSLLKADIYLGKLLGAGGTSTGPAKPLTPEAKAKIEQAVKMVLRAYEKLMNAQRQLRKNQLPEDPANFWGLAKSHFALKQYFEALPYYRELSRRIDPNKNHLRYWEAQLALCRCALKAYGKQRRQLQEEPQKNKEALEKNTEKLQGLRALMRQLEQEDPRKGGLYKEFNAIEAELKVLLR